MRARGAWETVETMGDVAFENGPVCPGSGKAFIVGWIGIWLVQLRVLLHGSDPSHTPQRKEGQEYGHG